MSYADIQESLGSIISNIEGVSKVLFARPAALTDAQFKELFTEPSSADPSRHKVNVWFLEWLGATPSRRDAPTNTYFVAHRFGLTGYLGFTPTSNVTMNDLAETVMDTLTSHIRSGIDPARGINVEDTIASIDALGQDQLGPTLCSFVTMTISVLERRQVASWAD